MKKLIMLNLFLLGSITTFAQRVSPIDPIRPIEIVNCYQIKLVSTPIVNYGFMAGQSLYHYEYIQATPWTIESIVQQKRLENPSYNVNGNGWLISYTYTNVPSSRCN